MGVAELVAAFNAVAEPRYSATKGFLRYSRQHDTEFQILTFSGIGNDGVAFSVDSDPIRPGGDVIKASVEAAQRFLAERVDKLNGPSET